MMEPNGELGNAETTPQSVQDDSLDSPPRPHDADAQAAKRASILAACSWNDTEALRALAASKGGLLSDDLRRIAWPVLLGYHRCNTPNPEQRDREYDEKNDKGTAWDSLPPHGDEGQVRLDVDRSFIYYPNNLSDADLSVRKSELSTLITSVLRHLPHLSYFQGYHDICQVFLLVLTPTAAFPAVARLSSLRIRDFMLPTLSPALSQLTLIPSLLRLAHHTLYRHLSGTQPFFALSGTLTMYAHDIQSYSSIARLFDILLAREAVFSVYMFASIVLSRSQELFEVPSDEPEMLHSILSKLPKPLDLEKLIQDTCELFEKYPPEKLPAWRGISRNSVLRTARDPDVAAKQTLEDGKRFFEAQVRELKWKERREHVISVLWKYRRPARNVGIAVLVGILSFYLRKSPAALGIFETLRELWVERFG